MFWKIQDQRPLCKVDPEEKFIDPDKPMYLRLFDETKVEQLCESDLRAAPIRRQLWVEANIRIMD